MIWHPDPQTQAAAVAHPLPLAAIVPAPQFPGRNFAGGSWNHRVINQHWPAPNFRAGPAAIIAALAAGNNLEGLAMVVSWGTMWRQPDSIYGHRHLPDIHDKIDLARESIAATNCINNAWMILTDPNPGGLGWSPVLSSKFLHFLCRSLGEVQDPPVAIDNAVILNAVWPAWRALHYPQFSPNNWCGHTLAAYLRYMTAIQSWATLRAWTTTEFEATVFSEY